MRVVRCLICDSQSDYYFTKDYAGSAFADLMRTIGPVQYHRCRNCGFVSSRTHAELPEEKWMQLNVGFHHAHENQAHENKAHENKAHEKSEQPNGINQPPYAEQALMLALLQKNGLIQSDTMLDYAAGYGTLSAILEKYFGMQLPIYDRYVQSDDIKIYVKNPAKSSYSTVINSAMFEHVLTRADLESVNDLVAPDGNLIIHTVVCENVPADPDWFYLRPPVHTAFHTNRSMNILMEQWGYRSSLYCPQSKCWLLHRACFAEIEPAMKQINSELQCAWFYGKSGFMDYWKGF